MNEIEHRYLLHSLPENISKYAKNICQTRHVYINGPKIQERFSILCIHSQQDPEGVWSWERTIKLGGGISRLEISEPISEELYHHVNSFPGAKRVFKNRFRVDHPLTEEEMKLAGTHLLVFEVDRFLDRDLFLAEVEVPSIDCVFSLPEWLQSCVIREVTNEAEFEGRNLAK